MLAAPMPIASPLRYRPTLAECKRRIVKAATDAAAYSRGRHDAANGIMPRESFAAYVKGWESFYQ